MRRLNVSQLAGRMESSWSGSEYLAFRSSAVTSSKERSSNMTIDNNKCKGSGYPVALHLLQLGHTHNWCGHCHRRVKILKNGRMASHR